MNLKVNLGKTVDGQDFFVDFEKQKIHLTLLLGATGTGKSVLGYHMYRQIVEQNSPDEITFVLIDNTRIEFTQWNQKSPYLYCPDILDQDLALETLERLANKVEEINTGAKHYFIHIEECDLFYKDPKRLEKSLKELLKYKENSKIHITFSTSRPATDVITPWLLELTDLKVVFPLASLVDSLTATGYNFLKDLTMNGQKIVIFKNQIYQLLPFTAQESNLANGFKL